MGKYVSVPQAVLISCYELGHQPFNLASPMAILAEAGISATGVDLSVEDLSEYAEEISAAQFIGFSVPMHTALRVGYSALSRVRALNLEAHICFYGIYAELNADYLLSGIADSVIAGEYEVALLELVQSVLVNRFDPFVPPANVRTRECVRTPAIVRVPFVQPQRSGLPSLENYARFQRDGELSLAGYTETTRGCKHKCLHCPVTPLYDGRFFIVPEKNVLEDIRAQVALGARHITFGDPDFLNGPGHARRIVSSLHTEFPWLTFDFTARVTHLLRHASILPEMADAGCAFVVSAVESLSDVVLANLEKGHTRADIVNVFCLMDRVGIPLRPSLLSFTPWTTLVDYLELLAFVSEKGLFNYIDSVQYSIRLLIPPGSAMLSRWSGAPWLGDLDEINYSYDWNHPDPRMDSLHFQVARVVQQAELIKQDKLKTFVQIEELAFALANQPHSEARVVRELKPSPAGLTESWFC